MSLLSVHAESVSISVMKYNTTTNETITDVSTIFTKLDNSILEGVGSTPIITGGKI